MEVKVPANPASRLASHRISVPGTPSTPLTSCLTPSSSNLKHKFAVFDLVEDAPPKTFHEAAERGNTSVIMRYIERTIDFDINQKDRLMRTALHWAAEMGHIDAAQTLLDFGADVKLKECTGRTAVHLAARTGDADMLKLLMDKLPESDKLQLINQGDANDITPVFLSLQRGEDGQAAFEYLLANGARYNEQVADEQPAGNAQQPAADAGASDADDAT
eukprot:jgi/Chrzof1/4583/Cz14g19050.t1